MFILDKVVSIELCSTILAHLFYILVLRLAGLTGKCAIRNYSKITRPTDLSQIAQVL